MEPMKSWIEGKILGDEKEKHSEKKSKKYTLSAYFMKIFYKLLLTKEKYKIKRRYNPHTW